VEHPDLVKEFDLAPTDRELIRAAAA